MSSPAVQVENLGKCFKFYPNKFRQLMGALLHAGNHAKTTWALRSVSFSLVPGSSLAIIGPNGAGKTTLLQLLAGLLKPSEGSVQVNGNLATLLELGSGFQLDLTGRENVFVTGGLKGFSRRDIARKLDQIIEFSELGEFIDHPVKHYSSGMMMRLAFATAINVEPNVLLVDEVFAVGDAAFQHKCMHKFRQLQQKRITTVLVTHDMIAAKSLCNLALLLDQGTPILFGNPDEVTNRYLQLVAEKIKKEGSLAEKDLFTNQLPVISTDFPKELGNQNRHGSGEGKICAIRILNSAGTPIQSIPFGDEVTFRFFIEYCSDVPESGIGFYLRDRYGNDITGINTFEESKPIGKRKKGDRLIVDFSIPVFLRPGSYSISPGLSYHPNEPRYLDWIDNAILFEVEKPLSGKEIYGFTYIPNQVLVRLVQERETPAGG